MSENLDLVRSISGLGTGGRQGSANWAPTSNGRRSAPNLRRAWVASLAAAWRGFLGAWADYRVAHSRRGLRAGRHGRSSCPRTLASALEAEGGDTEGANLMCVRDGKVTRLSPMGSRPRPRSPRAGGVGDVAGERGDRAAIERRTAGNRRRASSSCTEIGLDASDLRRSCGEFRGTREVRAGSRPLAALGSSGVYINECIDLGNHEWSLRSNHRGGTGRQRSRGAQPISARLRRSEGQDR